MDNAALEKRLKAELDAEVRFDDGSRALYATDASNYRQVPLGVVIPRTTEDVVKTVKICHELKVPLVSRGGGTSLAGQCCNVAVVLDMSKYLNRVLDINVGEKWALIEPGLILDDLRHAAEQVGLTFGPDPATHDHCTLGGMIGNNSCGVHALMAGKTSENVLELEILTYDGLRLWVGETPAAKLEEKIAEGGRSGEIFRGLKQIRDEYAQLIQARYPQIPRRVSGYNLDELLDKNHFQVARSLVGSEGTCVVVLRARVRLIANPACRALAVLGYPSVFEAADHVMQVLRHGPIGLEGIDQALIGYMHKKHLDERDLNLLPPGKGWLLVEFGGASHEEARQKAQALADEVGREPHAPSVKVFADKAEEKRLWEIRESGLGATAFVPGQPDTWPGWEDSAVDPTNLGRYLRDLRRLMQKFNYDCSLYGHFGQGCVHCRIPFDLKTAEGIAKYRAFIDEAVNLVVRHGGSLSGEHGDGQARAEFLPRMFGDSLVTAFEKFKGLWDPEGKMNPGKVVRPHRIDENLRLGGHYRPATPATYFHFPDDQGSLAHAALRCVGVGKCRRTEVDENSSMCPSFLVTREEKHTTRGRAHMLFEMLQGQVLHKGWREPRVKEALDLCLSCKGCKHDCPVNVDMATYKAEFLAHYYKGRLRPRSAYAMGGIYWWARLASHFPSLVNRLGEMKWSSAILKKLGGITSQRAMPRFARHTFRDSFLRRPPRSPAKKPKVVFWADTFTNHFHPEVGTAAVDCLERAGYHVTLPRRPLCCGRPLYDYGFLGQARRLLRQTLDTLSEEIAAGIPVVGAEPSCMAVFRDEIANLLPNDEHAKRLKAQSFLLSEFLVKKVKDFAFPPLNAKVLVQGHCHEKAIFGMDAQREALKRMKAEVQELGFGCCGMAGSFGFESEHYAISKKIADRGLVPTVKGWDTLSPILADGFSCRTQIEQLTGRKGRHLAELLQDAFAQQTNQRETPVILLPGQSPKGKSPNESSPQSQISS